MTWWDGRIAGFDLETTGVDVEADRIVTATVAFCGGGEPVHLESWLVSPGVPIPEEAVACHGITSARAELEGVEPADGVEEIIGVLEAHAGVLVAQNAPFDLTLLDREARRYGLRPLTERRGILVVDPLVVDKHLDRYRKGKRTLEAICGRYGARLEGAHSSDGDALAAARAAWVLGVKGRVIRKTTRWDYGSRRELPDPERAEEYEVLREEWERVRGDLRLLHEAQVRWAADQALSLAEHFRETGEDASGIRTEWPLVPCGNAVPDPVE